MPAYLLTGAAGFVGHWVAKRLLDAGCRVVGIDNLNDYYDPRIKHWRLEQLQPRAGFRFALADLTDPRALAAAAATDGFDAVFHLAARAGAPQSVSEPGAYIEANALGTQNVLDFCTARGVPKLVLASTSGVYGSGSPMPLGRRRGDGQAEVPLRRIQAGGRIARPCPPPRARPGRDSPALLHGVRPRRPPRT